jgi:hypothetical protein
MKKARHHSEVLNLENIPNVGKSLADDLRLIGIRDPKQLAGKNGIDLYKKLMRKTKVYHDPCVADVFMSAVEFMGGGTPKKWWDFTSLRKSILFFAEQ